MQLKPDFQSFIGWVDVVIFFFVSIPELRNEERARLELSFTKKELIYQPWAMNIDRFNWIIAPTRVGVADSPLS